eukprot:14799526-Alexandrium_andersonii.AAC.1
MPDARRAGPPPVRCGPPGGRAGAAGRGPRGAGEVRELPARGKGEGFESPVVSAPAPRGCSRL